MSVSGDSSSEQSSGYTNSDSENSDEEYFDGEIQPYAFEPVDETISDTELEGEMEVEGLSEHSDDENRLQNKDWLVMLIPSFS